MCTRPHTSTTNQDKAVATVAASIFVACGRVAVPRSVYFLACAGVAGVRVCPACPAPFFVNPSSRSMTSMADTLTEAQVDFTNAFNANRTVLAGFAKTQSEAELHCVRDGFYLGMAKALGLEEYDAVKKSIVEDYRVAAAAGTSGGFQQTIESARAAIGWEGMVQSLMARAAAVGSDLKGIWGGLETGRLEWIVAVRSTHTLKYTLRTAVEGDKEKTDRDLLEAKMVWIFSLGTVLPDCKEAARAWGAVACVQNSERPLDDFKPEAWDPRRTEWAALDLAVQAAAERAGTNLEEEWKM